MASKYQVVWLADDGWLVSTARQADLFIDRITSGHRSKYLPECMRKKKRRGRKPGTVRLRCDCKPYLTRLPSLKRGEEESG
jgi:hypothetical protein